MERVEEVGGVVYGEELDTKVAYSKDEGDGWGCVGPKTGCVRHRSVAVGLEVADEALICDDDGLL